VLAAAEPPGTLRTPSCCLEVLALREGGEPERVQASRAILETVATDTAAYWVPGPMGEWALWGRRDRPPGTSSWNCMLAASGAGESPLQVRLLWSGDLIVALRELESAAWEVLSRRFVCATVAAHRMWRNCHGADGPAIAALAPWNGEEPPEPGPPLTRKCVDEAAGRMLEALRRGEVVGLPARGTDACRAGLELGRLVWTEEKARALAATYRRADEIPGLLAWAVALHAAVRGVRGVEVCGVRVRAEGLEEAKKVWAQWCEWLACRAPAEFVQWVCPGGVWRPSRLVEPEDAVVPEVELCRSVRRALLEEAEKKARYAPWGAFVLEVPEEVFLHRWGVRELWLWVERRRMWCAVAGEDGMPHESFLWTARGGVATRLIVPPGPREALDAVLTAVWHDMVVAGEESVPEVSRGGARRSGEARGPGGTAGGPARAVVFPRTPRHGVELRGVRRWGGDAEAAAVRRAHAVSGHIRRLPRGSKPSASARAAAREWGIELPRGYTFVRPHVRGGQGDIVGLEAVRIRARGLITIAALLG